MRCRLRLCSSTKFAQSIVLSQMGLSLFWGATGLNNRSNGLWVANKSDFTNVGCHGSEQNRAKIDRFFL